MSSSSPEEVVLHIFELHADNHNQEAQGQTSTNNSSGEDTPEGSAQSAQATPAQRFLPFLRTIGLGTYHTSIQIRSKCYSFAAGAGVTQSNPPSTSGVDRYAPSNARHQESITLGTTTLSQGKINEVVNKLRETTFTSTSYHLMNRNCNHFTTTLAMALLHYDQLTDPQYRPKLDQYPAWVNRLARTGTGLGCLNGEGVDVICNPEREARVAVGADQKVGWNLSKPGNDNAVSATDSKKGTSGTSSNKKKELTEEQKKMLAKLKKKG